MMHHPWFTLSYINHISTKTLISNFNFKFKFKTFVIMSKPSASQTQIPTVHSLQNTNTRRSVSYNAQDPPPHKVDETDADNMMKASLTGLLNSQEVRSEARERKVQDMLMDTQKDLREKRRASLHAPENQEFVRSRGL